MHHEVQNLLILTIHNTKKTFLYGAMKNAFPYSAQKKNGIKPKFRGT